MFSFRFIIATTAFLFSTAAHSTGTWQTTLEALDLDTSTPEIEAYYDKTLDITWLADTGAIQKTPYAWVNQGYIAPLATFTDSQQWVSSLSVGKTTGWRLPKPSEIYSMFSTTLGNTDNLLTERGPFNLALYRPYNDWIGIYLWTADISGSIIVTFGMDGKGWNTARSGNPMIAWAVHDGKPTVETPASISGKIGWLNKPYSLRCTNKTTGQIVSKSKNKRATYDCSALGFVANPNDIVEIKFTGSFKQP